MKRISRDIVLPQGRQLWRLNEQGLLRLELDEAALVPGGPPEGWASITHAEAKDALAHAFEARWPGLGHWPARGEAWHVVDGLVLPLGEGKART